MIRRLRPRLLPPLLATVLLALAVYAQICCPQVFSSMRNLLFDAYMAVFPAAARAPVTVVEIDEQALADYGPWPWPQAILSRLLERLAAAGAETVALTLIPAEISERERSAPPARAEGDSGPDMSKDRLAVALPLAPSVIGYALTAQGGSAAPPPRAAGLAMVGAAAPRLHSHLGGTLLPPAESVRAAQGLGALNVLPDRDGRLRRVPLVVQWGEELYPSLAAEVLRVATGAGSYVVRIADDAATDVPLSIRIGPRTVPLNDNGEIWLHYAPRSSLPVLGASEVLAGEVPALLVAERSVLIGVSAPGIGSAVTSPLGESLSAAVIHAQVLSQLLTGAHPMRPHWAGGAEALAGALGSLLLILLSFRVRGAWLVVTGLLLVAAVLAGGFLLFREHLLLFDALTPGITIIAVFTTLSLAGYVVTERERRFVERAFSSFVSPNLVRHLMRHPEQLRLRGERRACSFVMTDLAGFTPLVERAAPESLVDLLNQYLDGLIRIAFAHDGTLERIVGDAVSVHFSAPVVQPDHARRALDCALAIDRFAADFAERMRGEGVPFGDTRIGVHTGEVIVGNFGGRSQLDYRAFGDPINTTARLESANRFFGTRVAVSADTAAQCPQTPLRPIGALILKGKRNPIETYTPLAQTEIDSGLAAAYDQAYHLAEQRHPRALAAFEECAARFPEDGLVRSHLQRLRGGGSGVEIRLEQ
jgi:adenylate cyclase